MSEYNVVPIEAFKLIPKFDGDVRHLNLFIRKCEYMINKFKSPAIPEDYLMQVVTSRLRGDAAAFVSEHGDIDTWSTFKTLIKQQFDDPRSEACLAMVLENLKIKNDETYANFYRRIQSLKSILFSKVDQTDDDNVRKSKQEFYNHIALQVFMYNLPEDVVAIIRMKAPNNLAEALSMVLDEMSFNDQYKIRSQWTPNVRPGLNFGTNQAPTYRSGVFSASNYNTTGALFGSTSSTISTFGTNSKPPLSHPFSTFGMSPAGSSRPQLAQADSASKVNAQPSVNK